MGRQSPPFLIGPAFLGILRLKGAAERFLDAVIAAAGKAFLHERFKVGWQVDLYGRLLFSLPLILTPYSGLTTGPRKGKQSKIA